jgi:hypothetical protein
VTRPFVIAGASVMAVQPDGRLAARLRTNLTSHDVTVVEGAHHCAESARRCALLADEAAQGRPPSVPVSVLV